ncbi:hypothetical protein [Citrobacter sp. NCU1]|uniref:hypothetical protein n=1 Tax=Citrobacter sp. NCU1 TaxID=2026683 RepID=UPI00406D35C7
MTSVVDEGLIDIHVRRPLVLSPEAVREWMRQDIGGKKARYCCRRYNTWKMFIWHAVTRAVVM